MSCPRPWLMVFLCACSFDALGLGEPSGTGTGSGSDASSSAALTGPPGTSSTTGPLTTSTSTAGLTGSTTGTITGDPTTAPVDPGTTTGDLTTSTTDTTTSTTSAPDTTGGTADDTTGPSPCGDIFVKQIAYVHNAVVVPPMKKVMSGQEVSLIAYSPVAEMGTVTFTVNIVCSDTYYLWGRVLEYHPGASVTNDPDSYYVQVDGGPESDWYYGCQTFGLLPNYHWLPVRLGPPGHACGSAERLALPLTPGLHTITLRNREGLDDLNHVAAVARILITNDPDYVAQFPD